MSDFTIRRIDSNEVDAAIDLAFEVFMEFEAPVYKPEGVETFKRDVVNNRDFLEKAKSGICPIYGAFDGDKIIGMFGMREDMQHINLVFTKKEYHRRGVATLIFNYLLDDVMRQKPEIKEITLNSSPYGLPFYLHIGFIPVRDEMEIDGIRFTPMKYVIK